MKLSIWYKRRLVSRRARRSGGGGASRAMPLLVLVVLVLFAALSLRGGLREAVEQMASSRLANLANRVINDAVAEQIAATDGGYDYFISLEKDGNGRITALKTDMTAVNRFKTEATARIIDHIARLDTSDLAIPLGNVLGWELLSGHGPKIPVRLVPVGNASAEFSGVFLTAGINQTRHQILMTIRVEISILLAGYTASRTVETQVVVAETVIVGEVPETYGMFEMGGS